MSIKENNIVLFDMDGTLTEPRQLISQEMLSSLKSLTEISKIGIVTGSGLEYIEEQLGLFFEAGGLNLEKVDFFPCNGTKHYRFKNRKFECLHDADMIEKIGNDCYRHILQTIFSFQLLISLRFDLPFTGTFFQYRGSMLNWCPIGRSARLSERKAWIDADEEYKIRTAYFNELKDEIDKKALPVDVAMGGSTSLDIYPTGWDKTYVINHLGAFKNITFIGDNCLPGGNDHHLYELLNDAGDHQSHSVTSPIETMAIIKKIAQSLTERT